MSMNAGETELDDRARFADRGQLVRTEFVGGDGLTIVADVGGPEEAPLVVLAHGGGQTRHSWKDTAQRLVAAGYHVASLDGRGHGESGWAPHADYDLPISAVDMELVTRAADTATKGVNLVGASWGGLTAMVANAALGDVGVRSIVLVDVVPHVPETGSARITGFMRAHLDGFDTLDDAIDAVATYRPSQPRPTSQSGILKNLRQTEDGRYHWHWDPARLDRKIMVDVDLLDQFAAKIACPVLLVRGGRSDIVSDEGVADLRKLIPQLQVVTIGEADHMVVGDDNHIFATALIDFLKAVSPSGA